jgi:hypothetical protein
MFKKQMESAQVRCCNESMRWVTATLLLTNALGWW